MAPRKLILCDCEGTNPLDGNALEAASGLTCSSCYSSLCTTELGSLTQELRSDDAIIACSQEHRVFQEIADELALPNPSLVDLRDRAGWSQDSASKTPKMAALLAEAQLISPKVKSRDIISEGLCLILGRDAAAMEVARALSPYLSVTLLLPAPAPDLTGLGREFEIVIGTLRQATGALGGFNVMIDGFQQLTPGGHGEFGLSAPRNGAKSNCDIILDLRGSHALFAAWDKREGYLRADPSRADELQHAVLSASHMVGTFEKPLYVVTEPALCAHSRAQKTGCTRCLDICPTGAISPHGEHVEIDPMICAGCGGCASLCPSGAIRYDAPDSGFIFKRLETLATSYAKAGGAAPRLLVHDENEGAEMVRLSARYGRGLPADVIPFATPALAGFGHAEILSALGVGFTDVSILLTPKAEADAPKREIALADAIAPGRAMVIDTTDPDAMSAALYDHERSAHGAMILPLGSRRQVTRLAAKALNPAVDIIALPDGAPYGAVLVDDQSCTLCLACVSLCPAAALSDNPERPEILFQEDACLQCGLCANICPEQAIHYAPRLNLTDAALSQQVLHGEDPFACIECGALFGVKSTIEKISEKLAGKHHMFKDSGAARMIQMCDNCRVQAQFHSGDAPMAAGERPRPRTTDDYLSERKDH